MTATAGLILPEARHRWHRDGQETAIRIGTTTGDDHRRHPCHREGGATAGVSVPRAVSPREARGRAGVAVGRHLGGEEVRLHTVAVEAAAAITAEEEEEEEEDIRIRPRGVDRSRDLHRPTCVAVVRGVAVRRVATEEDPPHLQTTAVGDPPLPVADGTVLLADAPCLALHLPSIAEEEGGGTGRRRRRHSVVGLTDPDRGHPLPVVGCRRR